MIIFWFFIFHFVRIIKYYFKNLLSIKNQSKKKNYTNLFNILTKYKVIKLWNPLTINFIFQEKGKDCTHISYFFIAIIYLKVLF